MDRYKTILVRSPEGFLSTNTVSTDGLSAIESIPWTNDVQIENESEDHVEISYLWTGPENFMETQEYLSKHGVMKKEA